LKSHLLFVFLLAGVTGSTAAPNNQTARTYTTHSVNPRPPVIDGRLDDTAWAQVDWTGDFIQHEPYEGKSPTEQTAFKILYDAKNLYVAIKAHDSQPNLIEQRLSRRDDLQGDFVAVQLDSYYDQQTAFTFAVSAAGVKADGIFSNDGDNEDWTVDPVWFVKTARDDQGWTAEMRIPLSQLRYGDKEHHIWGLQVGRQLFRKEEMSLWQHISRNASGWVHHFGTLQGIARLPKAKRIELLPYTVGKVESMEAESGNPFETGRKSNLRIGLDGKVGITSDLTLDFTVNPDFGQVEADPSEVNLTAYESYFQEKRPFFIEGRNILSYQVMMGDGDVANDNLFYSRRIGRRPSYSPDLEDDEYAKMPGNTTILGAMKLTGKTRRGLSVGVMDAVTTHEFATLDHLGERNELCVEPLTNYFLGRVQQDFRDGATKVGGMLTQTHRKLEDSHLDYLNSNALTGGVDFTHQWKDRTWFVDFKAIFSHISGSREAMLEQQESSRRYFQRPDNDYAQVDSSLTSMQGHGGGLFIGRSGNSHVNFAVGGTWRSPGLEINDIGYMREADMALQFTWVGLRWWEPFAIFRNLNVNLNQWYATNWGGDRVVVGGNINMHMQFKNYWGAGFGGNLDSEALSTSALRGGPALILPASRRVWGRLSSDGRKPLTGSVFASVSRQNDGIGRSINLNTGVNWRPNNSVSFSLTPFYNQRRDNLQYVGTESYQNEDRYLFGRINQKTLGMVIRLNYSITPDFTVQFYGQPFVSAGDYSRFKRITDSRAAVYEERYRDFSNTEIRYADEEWLVDEDRDGSTDYSLGQPDFNFREFRSNLVLRWQYRPGSTVYLVWSQGRMDFEEQGRFALRNDMEDLFRRHPHNVFLLKLNHWFSL